MDVDKRFIKDAFITYFKGTSTNIHISHLWPFNKITFFLVRLLPTFKGTVFFLFNLTNLKSVILSKVFFFFFRRETYFHIKITSQECHSRLNERNLQGKGGGGGGVRGKRSSFTLFDCLYRAFLSLFAFGHFTRCRLEGKKKLLNELANMLQCNAFPLKSWSIVIDAGMSLVGRFIRTDNLLAWRKMFTNIYKLKSRIWFCEEYINLPSANLMLIIKGMHVIKPAFLDISIVCREILIFNIFFPWCAFTQHVVHIFLATLTLNADIYTTNSIQESPTHLCRLMSCK